MCMSVSVSVYRCMSMCVCIKYLSSSGRMDEKLENALALKCIPPSQIPGRPKHWKNKCMEILVTSISNRLVYKFYIIRHCR